MNPPVSDDQSRHEGHGRPALRSLGAAWIVVAAIVVILDQVTKRWALDRLSGGRIIDLPGPSRLILSFNTGFAFGQGRGFGPIIAAFGMLAVLLLVTRLLGRLGPWGRVAVGLVIGGATGNLIDRMTQSPGWLRGGVVDFIQAFSWFPIFNVADMAITVGAVGVVISMSMAPDGTNNDRSPVGQDRNQSTPDQALTEASAAVASAAGEEAAGREATGDGSMDGGLGVSQADRDDGQGDGIDRGVDEATA